MNDIDYFSNFAGSSTANVLFVALFFVGMYVRKHLKDSRCRANCYVFDCEAHLDELKDVKSQVHTQRGMLQDVLDLLGARYTRGLRPSPIKLPNILLMTPPRRRASSV